jgi:catechol 2,3-dioxygenase-like lactoylglutathione lyase family enzyme
LKTFIRVQGPFVGNQPPLLIGEKNMNLTSTQVELFVADLDASIDFYERVLGFTTGERQPDGYTPMVNGPVRVSLNVHASLQDDHPIFIAAGERPGRGVEFVLFVDDLRRLYAHVLAQGWPISAEMQRRPWGMDDFRLLDPAGNST